MKISVAIMSHPKRTAEAAELLGQLLEYPFSSHRLVTDCLRPIEKAGEWQTGKRALRTGIEAGSDWHVVIQDDAILTPNFYENIEGAIKSLDQKTLVSLYTGTSRPLAGRVKAAVAKAQDGDMLRSHQLYWGVGIVIPTDHIKPMLEFVENIDLLYDNRIGEFYCRNGLPVYYTAPSLVNHDDDAESLLDGHGRAISPEPRVAHKLAVGLVAWSDKRIFI